ncbi:12767_t:CDS:2 [Funneliformis geosporum]|uniref:12767_t:CDS:1 n=1 Tax=Funneliformis geosporum TaxID=1117311 RepID=A0A9W4SMG9_9GLOM|nr:12767_t:CDS:2 [Funneliformis geosporum]
MTSLPLNTRLKLRFQSWIDIKLAGHKAKITEPKAKNPRTYKRQTNLQKANNPTKSKPYKKQTTLQKAENYGTANLQK